MKHYQFRPLKKGEARVLLIPAPRPEESDLVSRMWAVMVGQDFYDENLAVNTIYCPPWKGPVSIAVYLLDGMYETDHIQIVTDQRLDPRFGDDGLKNVIMEEKRGKGTIIIINYNDLIARGLMSLNIIPLLQIQKSLFLVEIIFDNDDKIVESRWLTNLKERNEKISVVLAVSPK